MYIYIYIRITRYSRVAASLLIAAERYSLETFRGVGFSSRARGHRKGRGEGGGEREKARWFPEFEGAGAVFSVRFWRRDGGMGEEECLIPRVHRPPLSYMKYLYRGIFGKLIFDSHANLLHTWFLVDATLRGMMARFTRQPLFLLFRPFSSSSLRSTIVVISLFL